MQSCSWAVSLRKNKTQFFKFYPHPTGERLKDSTDYWERVEGIKDANGNVRSEQARARDLKKMRYDYNQLAEMLGADRLRIANIVSRYKIEKIVDDNRVFFSESAVEEIKKHLNTRPRKYLYKVSVFQRGTWGSLS